MVSDGKKKNWSNEQNDEDEVDELHELDEVNELHELDEVDELHDPNEVDNLHELDEVESPNSSWMKYFVYSPERSSSLK